MINKGNYLRNIPIELRAYKQWLWFKKIRKQDLKGKEKILKLPVSPITLDLFENLFKTIPIGYNIPGDKNEQ